MRISSYNSIPIQNALQRTSAAIAKSLERLSSGKRINSAKDGAADYALGVGLESQIRGYTQAVRNINDAAAVVETASSAISSQIELLQKMREIAVQASNGTLTSSDRDSLQSVLDSLFQEFTRITSTTNFAGQNLLDGSFETKQIQVGMNKNEIIDLYLPSLQASSIFEKTIGTGTFTSVSSYTLNFGNESTQPVFGDFDGDGKLDLLIFDGSSGTFATSLGQGDGTFGVRKSFGSFAEGSTHPLATADINHDGNLDFIAASSSTNINIYLGNGDGSFQSPTTAGSSGAYDVGLADLNNDGNLDIYSSNGSGQVEFSFGNGDGSFAARRTISATAGNTISVKAADINNDGYIDFVATDNGSSNISIRLGNGDGTFSVAATLTSGGTGFDSEIADINNDGILDLLTMNQGAATVSAFIGNGNGTFRAKVDTSASSITGRDIHTLDYNKDGNLDIVTGNFNSIENISLYMGNGDGTFNLVSSNIGTHNQATNAVSLGDINSDGVEDLVATYYDGHVNILTADTRESSAISNLSVETQTKAQALIGILDRSMTTLLGEQSALGALHSRLDIASSSTSLQIDNLSEAKSQVLDVDIAEETAELVRQQILQQVQVAALAQANLSAQSVIDLLKPLMN